MQRTLEVGSDQIVGASAAALEDSRCCRANQVAIHVEGVQQAGLVGLDARLNFSQGVGHHKERGFHCAVMAPKSDSLPSRIVAAAMVRETQGHRAIRSEGSAAAAANLCVTRPCRDRWLWPREPWRGWP